MIKSATVRRLIISFILASSVAALFTGCTAKTEDDSTIPWSRPASWEGQMPGFGG
ncbi:hypothetical protein [Puniceicoccus vermicola]|uniref:Uncharacterized protein n=1 Tax=Puniceicoccus vermicola TaxID=388746 RepID=A0A7X1AWU1_9BACT|nr:hypothetical protein [Puniceicoccus vermicola]MBC2601334.1 hypothetical protein [Puniceicoccus vermicola]